MKRITNSASAAHVVARQLSTSSKALQFQRPDIIFETHGANLIDSGRETFGNNPFSNYKPSARPADLTNTPVDIGLGTSAADPYIRTLPNIATTNASLVHRNEVSYGLTGPVSTVLTSAVPTGAANSLIASANAKRQLSIEEIASLEKGHYTLSEWFGVASQSSPADTISEVSKRSNLLKVYIDNFLKIDVPTPKSAISKSHIDSFSAKGQGGGLEGIALANGRADFDVIVEQWKTIASKFDLSSDTGVPKYPLNPEHFLRQLEVAEREALLFLASLAYTQDSSTANKTSDAAKSTEQLLNESAPEAALAIKALVSQAIEDRNKIVDSTIGAIVSNNKTFDEGNAVWRALLRTFDSKKREIFVHAVLGESANEQQQLELDMADTSQLAMFEWVLSHDRPLPKVSAPVALLMMMAAIRCTIGSPEAIAATFDAASAEGSSTTQKGYGNAVIDSDSRSAEVTKVQTIGHLSLLNDDMKTRFLAPLLDGLLTGKGTEAAAQIDHKRFIERLRHAGFDVEFLQKIELQFVHVGKQRELARNRLMSVVGSEDAGAPQDSNQEGGAQPADVNSNKHQTRTSGGALSTSERQQVAPLVSLFQNLEGASVLFLKLCENVAKNSEEAAHVGKAFGFPKIDSLASLFKVKKVDWWSKNYKTFAEVIVTDQRVLEQVIIALKPLIEGSSKMVFGIVSKEGKDRLDTRLASMNAEKQDNTSRVNEIRKVLLARQNVGKAVECAAYAGANVSKLFRVQELLEKSTLNHNAIAISTANDASIIEQIATAVIGRHPQWATAGVIPTNPADFNQALIAVAAHVFVRLSYVPHATLAVLKRNYRGRIGEVFIPSQTSNKDTPQPRHQNIPVELGKVEHYDTNLYKRNDPQGWYQRMQDIHNRNVSVKVDLRDLRVVSDDYAATSSTFAPAANKEETDNATHGKKPYFGLQQERRLRVLAGERVGMNIIKLDSDRYEDQPDNERFGVTKMQQLLSDAKKTELGEEYWPTVEVKVRNPSGQSKAMQSLIDYNRIEAQSRELFAQYREIKKKALFVSPTDLYLKDRSVDAAAAGGSSRTSVTSEGYVVGSE